MAFKNSHNYLESFCKPKIGYSLLPLLSALTNLFCDDGATVLCIKQIYMKDGLLFETVFMH